MKLPSWLTTVTPLSKAIALLLFILFPILFFFIGVRYGALGSIDTNEDPAYLKNQLIQSQKKLADTQNEMDDIINNRGTITKEYDTTFKDSEFGLYSSLFEGKQVHVTVYKYKQTLITRRQLQVNEDTYAITWTYESISPNNTLAMAIFDAYENHGLQGIAIDEFQSQWNKEKPYISNNRTLYWNYGYSPRTISSLYLEGILSNVSNQKPIFFRLTQPVELQPYQDEFVDSSKGTKIAKAKEALIKIADQIPYRKTN